MIIDWSYGATDQSPSYGMCPIWTWTVSPEAIAVVGPWNVVAMQVFEAGMVAGEVFEAGMVAGKVFEAGMVAGEVTDK